MLTIKNIYKSYGYTSKELDYFWNVTFKGNLFNRIGNSLDFLLNMNYDTEKLR